MNIRRIALDVDWASNGPTLEALAEAIDAVEGVQALNITVTEIDLETVGSDITVEGENIDTGALEAAIESAGAVVHSTDHLAAGERIIELVTRIR